MNSFQDFTFSTIIQDGIPRNSQRDQKGKCLTGGKTLATFYWIWWGPFRTPLFPPGSRMGSQGTTKGTKKETAWHLEKPEQVFIGFYEVPASRKLPASALGCQKAVPRNNPEARKMDKGFIVQGGHVFRCFSVGLLYWKDALTVGPSGKEYHGFEEVFKE